MIPGILNSAKALTAGCTETVGKCSAVALGGLSAVAQSVFAAVSQLFAYMAQGCCSIASSTIAAGTSVIKGAIALSPEIKIVAGITLLLLAAGGAVYQYRAGSPVANAPVANAPVSTVREAQN